MSKSETINFTSPPAPPLWGAVPLSCGEGLGHSIFNELTGLLVAARQLWKFTTASVMNNTIRKTTANTHAYIGVLKAKSCNQTNQIKRAGYLEAV